MRAYRRDFDQTKYMPFLIKHDELLQKYDEIWEKVKNSIKKNWQWTCLQWKILPKIKSCHGKTNKNFHNNKIIKEGSQFICL